MVVIGSITIYIYVCVCVCLYMFYDLPADFMAFKDLYKILTDNFFTSQMYYGKSVV
jgi:hypothetical protein